MKMKDVIFQELNFSNNNKEKGAILIYKGSEDPTPHLDEAVSLYVGNNGYNEFIDANLDNPWVRVIIKGINDIPQTNFDPNIHKL